MSNLRRALLCAFLIVCSGGYALQADDMSNELKSFDKRIDSAVEELESLNNKLDVLLEETEVDSPDIHKVYVAQNDENAGLLLAENKKYGLGSKKASKKSKKAKKKKKKKDKDQGKKLLTIQKGDTSLTIGGSAKVEHFFKDNVEILNSKLPNQSEYFKNTLDLIFDFAYGEKKFGHKAVQAYLDLRHKGVWGLGANYADSDATNPVDVKFLESSLGKHSHTNGKPLIWIFKAWLQFSLNAALGQTDAKKLHFVKLGWFPFELGRGIALGSFYGLNREGLGLYSYNEDKAAPGILITGEILKDVLSYDLYYSKFEERGKSLRYTLNTDKEQILGRKTTPWRGVAKDDEVFAARLKWKALKDSKVGSLELEPYIFYNEGSDQKVRILADTKMELGTIGLAAEHKYKNFEIGGEVAFNFGEEKIKPIDQNIVKTVLDDAGHVRQVFSHITGLVDDPDAADADKTWSRNFNTKKDASAIITPDSKKAAKVIVCSNEQELVSKEDTTIASKFKSAKDRIQNGYKNKLRGWMAVIDAAYTFEDLGITVAAAYGYASGDKDPQVEACDKTYKGFIGLHELYVGKRVKSIFYDDRILFVPSSLGPKSSGASQELAFTNLHLFGLSATLKPDFCKRIKMEFNPNMLFYWKDVASKKYVLGTDSSGNVVDGPSDCEDARKFVGTEINLMAKIEPIKDLTVFGNFAVFLPGGFYEDVKGVKMDKDYFEPLQQSVETDLQAQNYRMGDDVAYHINIGVKYDF